MGSEMCIRDSVNIASLNAHIDGLRTVLAKIKFEFDIIGISEYKIKKVSTPPNNIDILGYSKFEFEPTCTTHGGAGFYIKNDNVYEFYYRHKSTAKNSYSGRQLQILL